MTKHVDAGDNLSACGLPTSLHPVCVPTRRGSSFHLHPLPYFAIFFFFASIFAFKASSGDAGAAI